MKLRLHWKLMLVTTVPVIALITGIIWLAFDQLAADYFMVLMDKYMVSPTDTHRAFLTAVHRYLLWASLIALGLAFLLSYLLTRRVLRPLVQMSEASRQIAAGNFTARVEVLRGDERPAHPHREPPPFGLDASRREFQVLRAQGLDLGTVDRPMLPLQRLCVSLQLLIRAQRRSQFGIEARGGIGVVGSTLEHDGRVVGRPIRGRPGSPGNGQG